MRKIHCFLFLRASFWVVHVKRSAPTNVLALKILTKCSRITCKFCLCYKRIQDGANENILASEEYQQYMDDLSSYSGSESDKYNSSLYLDVSGSDMDYGMKFCVLRQAISRFEYYIV